MILCSEAGPRIFSDRKPLQARHPWANDSAPTICHLTLEAAMRIKLSKWHQGRLSKITEEIP